jgi:integrase
MALPKYVEQRRNGYFYQRWYPKSVASFAPAKKFTMSLGVSVGESDRAIQKAAIACGEAFDMEVARLGNTSVTAASDAAIDMLAAKALKSLRLPDSFVTPEKFPIDIEEMAKAQGASPEKAREIRDKLLQMFGETLSDPEKLRQTLEAADAGDEIAKQAGYTHNPVGDDFNELKSDGEQMVAMFEAALPDNTETDRLVKERVMKRLTTRPSDLPELLSGLWEPYLKFRGVEHDMSNNRFRKKQRDWDYAMACIGDHRINSEAQVAINAGLKERVQEQLARGVKASSAIRSIAMASACFKWAVDEWDLPWNIKTVRTPSEEPSMRKVANREQMIEVARKCVEWNDVQGVMGIMACHGIIPSEIARLEVTRGLASEIPHVVLPPGKTAHRKRVVPIMWGYDQVLDHMDSAIQYCRESKDPSATFNKRLRQMFEEDDQITLYGLRHGCRQLFVRAGSSTPVLQATLGWAGGDQGMHLHYGSDGIGDSEFVKLLYEEGLKAHGPIIEALA